MFVHKDKKQQMCTVHCIMNLDIEEDCIKLYTV